LPPPSPKTTLIGTILLDEWAVQRGHCMTLEPSRPQAMIPPSAFRQSPADADVGNLHMLAEVRPDVIFNHSL
jgi:hypothetical protein